MIRYIIIPVADITNDCIRGCVSSNLDTARRSLDGTQVVIKYRNNLPEGLSEYTTYSRNEIIAILKNEDWQEDLNLGGDNE